MGRPFWPGPGMVPFGLPTIVGYSGLSGTFLPPPSSPSPLGLRMAGRVRNGSHKLASIGIKVYSSGPWEGPLRSDTLPLPSPFRRVRGRSFEPVLHGVGMVYPGVYRGEAYTPLYVRVA